ncbi:MAG TPA: serine/threonine-protein kinase [Polyangia bacterium]|jgi:tRNA A-37 threonylcarbamoyl transferase component Bud32|nr:serine/threonine-protein kinase [Polyangia bacterium]
MAEGEQTLRRYDLLERVAVGGMAEIFRAKAHGAHGFEKTLAIKRILPDLARDAEFERRFIAEAKLAVTLTHANIVQIFDFGRFAGSLYIAMEYVDGPDLGRFLKAASARGEGVPLGAAMHIAMEMCKGLDVAHARRVVHSDISPSNILLSRLGEVKIADFGIARAAAVEGAAVDAHRDTRVMGKWPYMSPEQTHGAPLDARSDLFSAAVVMYELFTGDKLFRGRDVDALVESVRTMPISPASARRPALPPALDEVLAKALERDPARRYQQASELLRALLDVSYSHTVVATAMDVAAAVGRWLPPVVEEAAPGGIDTDALIRAELGLTAASTTGGSGPRVTQRGSAPALAAVPTSVSPVESSKTVALPNVRPKVTFVRGEQGADGVAVWELTIAGDPAIVPAAPSRARPRRRWIIAGAALAVGGAVAFAVGAGAKGERASARAELTIESTPAGAQILLDGRAIAAPAPTTIAVERPSPGAPHRLELRLPGYRDWIATGVVLKPGERAFYRAALEAPATRLLVTTTPPGAEVAVDGRTVGRTPLGNVSLAADGRQHTLRLRRHDFVDVVEPITLVDRRDVVVDRKLVAAQRFGTIDLHVDPWAIVYLDGRKVGEAPVKGLSLPIGHHRLKLVNPVRHKQLMLAVDVPAKHAYRVKLP